MIKAKKIGVILALAVMLTACGGKEVHTGTSESIANTETGAAESIAEKEEVSDVAVGGITEEMVRNHSITDVGDFEYEKVVNGEGIRIKKYIGKDTIVIIPETIDSMEVTSIGSLVFGNESSVRGVNIPESVKEMRGVFSNNDDIEVVICEGTMNIDYCTFLNCSNLHTIILGENVTTIGENAFAMCSSLKELYIPESVTEISEKGPFEMTYDVTVIGKSGSTIEAYCKENEIPFKAAE